MRTSEGCVQKMYLATCDAGGEWRGGITDYAPLPLDPAALVCMLVNTNVKPSKSGFTESYLDEDIDNSELQDHMSNGLRMD